MKKIIVTIVFVLVASTVFAQYKMSIKKADNTTEDIWVHDIINLTFTDVSFTCGTSTITYAGQTYNTVLIGSQCWLKENLNVGTKIAGNGNQTNNSTIEKYCYSDADANCTTYGGLYQWAEAVQYLNGATNAASPSPAFSGNVQGICPTGWHIPTNTEQQTLKTAVGNDGYKLLAGRTNESGFSALLAGYYMEGTFQNLSSYASFWSSVEYAALNNAEQMFLGSGSSIGLYSHSKVSGFSVRCVKD